MSEDTRQTEADEGRGRGWAAIVIAMTTALLLVFNAASPRAWAALQPPSALTLVERDLAERWWAVTDRLGLTAPRRVITEGWARLLALRWSEAPASGADQR